MRRCYKFTQPVQIILSLIFLLLITSRKDYGQIVTLAVNASPMQTYTTLGDAFNDLNNGTYSGTGAYNIVIYIDGTTTEPVTAVLNGSGIGLALYSSIQIVAGGLNAGVISKVTGNIAGPLVEFNGVDGSGISPTINGKQIGTPYYWKLEFDNASTSSNASTFKLTNGSHNISMHYSFFRGAETGTSSGTIYFGKPSGTIGNSNNELYLCYILETALTSTAFPTNSIYSESTSGQLFDNTNNAVAACYIGNFFNASQPSCGIKIDYCGAANWIIVVSRFYQSSSRYYTSGNIHRGIYITEGSGHNISSNTIGYANNNGAGICTLVGGTSTTSLTNDTRFTGIEINTTIPGTAIEITNNEIDGIELYTSSNQTTGTGTFCGISVSSASELRMSNANYNRVGNTSTTFTPSVSVYNEGNGLFVGFRIITLNTSTLFGNQVQNCQIINTSPSFSETFIGIAADASNAIGTSSGIGIAVVKNIQVGAALTTGSTRATGISFVSSFTSAQSGGVNNSIVENINCNGTGDGSILRGIEISDVRDFSCYYNSVSFLSANTANSNPNNPIDAITGIYINNTISTTSNQMVIFDNVIHDLNETNTSASSVDVGGISLSSYEWTNTERNKIYDLYNTAISTSAYPSVIYGIKNNGVLNSCYIDNNMISLGSNVTNDINILGIWDDSFSYPMFAVYYNSVLLQGNSGNGSQSTFSFYKGEIRSFGTTYYDHVSGTENNIFENLRTGSGAANHFSIGNGINSTWLYSNSTCDYNSLNSANINTVGLMAGAPLNFTTWQTVSNGDAHSIGNIPTVYVNPTTDDLHVVTAGNPNCHLDGTGHYVLYVAQDIDMQFRDFVIPDIGADEFTDTHIIVDAGPDLPACGTNPVTLNGTITGMLTTGHWVTVGMGTITNPTSVSGATYTPDPFEAECGSSVYCTLISDDPTGPCGAVADQMIIYTHMGATPNAGLDQYVCSQTAIPITGTLTYSPPPPHIICPPNLTTLWTSSGTGSFVDATLLSTTYNASASDISGGSVVLTLTVNTSCGPVTDQSIIYFGSSSLPSLGPILGTNPNCYNGSAVFTITNPIGGVNYNWSLNNANFIITAGNGSSQVTISFNNFVGNAVLSVYASNACANSPTSTLTINSYGVPGVPGTITGQSYLCVGTSYSYSVLPVNGATSYSWYSNPVGLISPQTTIGSSANLLCTGIPTGGSLACVTANNACGSGAPRCKGLGSALPGIPTSPSGPDHCLCNTTQTYTVNTIAGATYVWNVINANGSVSSGGTSTVPSFSFTFGSNFVSCQITVQAVNSCGASAVRTSQTLFGAPDKPAVITGPASVCRCSTATYSTSSTCASITSYHWYGSNGMVINSGQGTSTVSVTWPCTGNTGQIAVWATNGCGNSGTRTLAVTMPCRVANPDQEETINENYIELLPNPTSDNITLKFNSDAGVNVSINIYDISGRLIIKRKEAASEGENNFLFDLKKMSKGVYYLDAIIGEDKYRRKIIVQ